MADILSTLRQQAQESAPRILLPEGNDERVLRAAANVGKDGIVEPAVIDIDGEARKLCIKHDIPTDRIEFVPLPMGDELREYAEQYTELRDTTVDTAYCLLDDPLVFGGLSVRLREFDGLVAGATSPTADVAAVANGIIGLSPEIDTASSYFLMIFEKTSIGESGVLLYADCGINIDPNAEQLADIAITTANTAQTLLDWDPRIAMLSFSTKGSAEHQTVETVARATKLAQQRSSDLLIEGEIQADTALNSVVAGKKLSDKDHLKGDANILIFPDLNAGNISYKLTEQIAGAHALGPILQGYARPVSDLSRGASVEDIINITTITAAQSVESSVIEGKIIERGLLNRKETSQVTEIDN